MEGWGFPLPPSPLCGGWGEQGGERGEPPEIINKFSPSPHPKTERKSLKKKKRNKKVHSW